MVTERALQHNVLFNFYGLLLQKNFRTYVPWNFSAFTDVLKLSYHLWHII
jgi:hypothetical protein